MMISKTVLCQVNNEKSIFSDHLVDDTNTIDPNSSCTYKRHMAITKRIVIANNTKEVVWNFDVVVNNENLRTRREIISSLGIDECTISNVLKLFKFFTDNISHATSKFTENYLPLYLLNYWGYGLCSDSGIALGQLLNELGVDGRRVFLNGHFVNEYFVDGKWVLLDADLHSFYLSLDNQRISSYDEVISDPFLLLRTKTGGGASAYSVEDAYSNSSLFEFVDLSLHPTLYGKFMPCDDAELGWHTLYPGEDIVYHLDRVVDKPLAKINIDCWPGVKESSLGYVQYNIDLSKRRLVTGDPLVIVKTKYPILRIILCESHSEYEFSREECVCSYTFDTDEISGMVKLYCQGAKNTFPTLLSGDNTIQIISEFSSKESLAVSWQYSLPTVDKLPEIEVISKTLSFEYTLPNFMLKCSSSTPSKLWWQISSCKKFTMVPPSLDNIIDYQSSIDITQVQNTFLNSNETYYFRVRVMSDMIWGDWSTTVKFSVLKPNRPSHIRISYPKKREMSIQWNGDDGVDYYIFGSNRLDFIPDIYTGQVVRSIEAGASHEIVENVNLITRTKEKVVHLPEENAFLRIIAKKGEAYSVPSELIKIKGQNSVAKVLQMRHIKIENTDSRLGYTDVYKATLAKLHTSDPTLDTLVPKACFGAKTTKTVTNKCAEWELLFLQGAKAAIYGGGMHTESILKICSETLNENSVKVVIDRAPTREAINEIPLVKADSFDYDSVDFIIISSNAYEQEIYGFLLKKIPEERIKRIYG